MFKNTLIKIVSYITVVITLLLYSSWALTATNVAKVTTQLEVLRANKELSSERKDVALELLIEAQQILERVDTRSKKIRALTLLAATVDKERSEAEKEIARLQQAKTERLPDNTSTSYLDSELKKLETDRVTSEALLSNLLIQEGELVTRASEIGGELTKARKDVGDLEAQPVDETLSDPVSKATYTNYFARLVERKASIEDLIEEKATLPNRQELVAVRIALTNAKLTNLRKLIGPIQERLGQTRINQARSISLETKQALLEPFETPGLKRLALENDNLATRNVTIVEQYTGLLGITLGLQQELTTVIAAGQTVEQVLQTGQLNDDTANLLRVVEKRLPNIELLSEKIKKSNEGIISLRLNRILWQDRLRNLTNLESVAISNLAESGELEPSESVLQASIKMLGSRKETLTSLISFARDTAELQSDQKKIYEDLRIRTVEQKNVLQRHFLWLPTRNESKQDFVRDLRDNLIWLTSPKAWYNVGKSAIEGYQKLPVLGILFGILAFVLVISRRTLFRGLQSVANRVGNLTLDTYPTSLIAMFITLGLAIPWSLLIASVGFAIQEGAYNDFNNAVSQGLFASAVILLILNSLRTLAVHDGVFHRHFNWSEQACELLRFHLFWITITLLFVSFIFNAALTSESLTIKYGIGRLTFITGAISVAVFSYYLLKPVNGIVSKISPSDATTTVQKVLFFMFVCAPILIAGMSLFGYFEAAIALQEKLFLSGVIFLFAGVMFSLGIRLFLIGHRRLTFKRITEERQRKREEREKDNTDEQSGDAVPLQLDDDVIDLETLSKESIKSLNIIVALCLIIGLSSVWSSMLPAFGILDEIILWQGTKYVNDVSVISDVSLWNVIIAVFFLVGGVVVAKNVRGLLELVVFERFNFDPGSRYATVTITGYVLIGIGVVSGLSQLGVNWSSMQWIIAALGVGLGFGLQEIVANFVSGLIILFERPVRVGDIVSVGQLEGTVTSIKIRATRITDFDNRQVLIPNKAIITENVTNWTLADQVTRIKIQIGVAYGSDVDEVRDLIFDTISKHPDTLCEPKPAVFFLSHGDSSLDFEARVFVGATSRRLPVTHEINRNLNMALAEKGIEIPFPQRDLNIKNNTPID